MIYEPRGGGLICVAMNGGGDLSTAYPQLVNTLLTALPIALSVCAFAYALYLHHLFTREFPSNSTINRLRGEVEELSGLQADLSDRFSRFQKRQDMRAARAEKTAQDDILEQARRMVADGATGASVAPSAGTSPKAALYSKIRGH